MRQRDTPVLIPNTMVKTLAAEGTILETIWESRRLPDTLNETTKVVQIDVVIRGTEITGPPRNLFRGEEEEFRSAASPTRSVRGA